MKKGLIIVGIVIIALVIVYSRHSFQIGGEEEVTEVLTTQTEERLRPTVNTHLVKEQDLSQKINFHGRFVADSQVAITPKIPGRVGEVYVKVGDIVSQGDAILQLETEELLLQVRQAEASLQVAKANLARITAGARAEEVEQVESGYRQAEASYNQAQLNYERSKRLFEEGVISARDWEAIEAQYEVAKAQLFNAEKSLILIRQGARAEDISSAQASVAQAEVALEMAELTVKNATITSPIDGTVSRIHVERGYMAGAGMPVAHVVNIFTVKLNLQATGRDVVRIREGQKTLITVDALPNATFQGAVATISPAAEEGSGLFAVTIAVKNPDGVLRPGMYGTASILIEEREGVVAVPSRALATRDGERVVFVIEERRIRQLPVEIGVEGEGYVEIVTGLHRGDLIVASGHESLEDGVEVRVLEGRETR